MTSWAESFTHAATWQLKTELAYWKAKAKSLEYENEVLHNVIRENSMQFKHSAGKRASESEDEDEHNVEETYEDAYADEQTYPDEQEVYKTEDNDDLEVSEEFVNFLRENAKYREDARQERERYKAKEAKENIVEEIEAGPSKPKDKTEELKELYGDNWMKIAAIENYVQSNFINESDICQPMYWPNIPFNFNFS
ncbi:gem-associated protein 8-like [Hyposmocoma kahamanoa]|uniref:gem-associated protein 8-like n=1 Tax=Hyposmocoma kahamanoa TaxID=1477025 RepID=UPI000E6DA42F|nr:gem-associated protein 8-like [Hyposmocoma kahamanoa]